MEMQQVRYFLAVAKTLNFTRAAEECNVSQPSLTRAIQALEGELGGDLIRREGRLSHLTELGARMLPLLRQCYESAQTAKAIATSVKKGETSTLNLCVARTIDLVLLMQPISELFRMFPGMQLKLKRGNAKEVAQLLKSGMSDLAIGGPLGEDWDRLEAWPMFNESFDMVVSPDHALAMHDDVGFDVELVRQAHLLVHSDMGVLEEGLAGLANAGFNMSDAHQVDSMRDIEALVVANLGVAVVPASAMQSAHVKHIPCAGLDLRRTVAIYTIAGRPRTREAGTLLNLLRGADWGRLIDHNKV